MSKTLRRLHRGRRNERSLSDDRRAPCQSEAVPNRDLQPTTDAPPVESHAGQARTLECDCVHRTQFCAVVVPEEEEIESNSCCIGKRDRGVRAASARTPRQRATNIPFGMLRRGPVTVVGGVTPRSSKVVTFPLQYLPLSCPPWASWAFSALAFPEFRRRPLAAHTLAC